MSRRCRARGMPAAGWSGSNQGTEKQIPFGDDKPKKQLQEQFNANYGGSHISEARCGAPLGVQYEICFVVWGWALRLMRVCLRLALRWIEIRIGIGVRLAESWIGNCYCGFGVFVCGFGSDGAGAKRMDANG